MAPTQSRLATSLRRGRHACPHCQRILQNQSGLTQHLHSAHTIQAQLQPEQELNNAYSVNHPIFDSTMADGLPASNQCRTEYHPRLNGLNLSKTMLHDT
jgi:hypothetical protein